MIPDRDHDDSCTSISSSDPSMSSFQLSTGCCAHLPLSSCVNESNWKEEYVVQFLSVKKVVRGNSERYRLIISDGTYFIQGMLATHCNALVKAENIRDYTVAVIERWTSNIVQNRRCVLPVFLIADGSHCYIQIGDFAQHPCSWQPGRENWHTYSFERHQQHSLGAYVCCSFPGW